MSERRDTCETCKFWQRGWRRDFETWSLTEIGSATPSRRGECRIRSTNPSFPPKIQTDWCGEHKPKDDAR